MLDIVTGWSVDSVARNMCKWFSSAVLVVLFYKRVPPQLGGGLDSVRSSTLSHSRSSDDLVKGSRFIVA